MKKTNVYQAMICVLLWLACFSILFALPVHAAEWSVTNPFTGWGGNLTLQSVIAKLINIAFMAAGLVAVIYLIIGGFRYVTSSGNAEAIEGAKATILNAIIGLIVIFISFLLVNYILGALHIGGSYRVGQEGGGLF